MGIFIKKVRLSVLVLAGALALTACAGHHNKKHADHAPPARIVYSPNGEPLNGGPLGNPPCQEAMTKWFDRVDTTHDGTISQDEFLADAKAQFQRMDIDKNGILVSEELERYRQPYRQFSPTETSTTDQEAGRHHGRGQKGGEDFSARSQGIAVDPVMSADANLDNKVTFAEFMAYAQKKFTELDADHSGGLSRAEITSLCEHK